MRPERKRRLLGWALALGLALQPALLARALQTRSITQSGRAFSQKEIQIGHGDTIRFLNADEFLHHLYVDSPTFTYASADQEPGQAVDVRFPVAGTFSVRCEIHPKMLLRVTVE